MSGFHVHPAAINESNDVGSSTRIWANAHVMSGARIGSHCNIGEGVFIEAGVIVGDHVTVKNGVALWEGVRLDDFVFVGPGAVFTNDLRPRSHPDLRTPRTEWLPTNVREGATIGANATVVCGNDVGAWAFVAAGAVVVRPVLRHALVAGNPARRAGWVCRCAETLSASLECGKCGRAYDRADGGLVSK